MKQLIFCFLFTSFFFTPSLLASTPFLISSWGKYPDEQAFALYTKAYPDGEYAVLLIRTLTLKLIVVQQKLPYSIKGKWAHLAFTFTGGIIQFYLDGEPLGSPFTGAPPGTQMNGGTGIIYVAKGGLMDLGEQTNE